MSSEMPIQSRSTKDGKTQKLNRSHSGCKSCRRRGKRCDETKPSCLACTRLSLECSYGLDINFRNVTRAHFQKHGQAQIPSSQPAAIISLSDTKYNVTRFNDLGGPSSPTFPTTLDSGDSIEANYFNHFQSHVRRLLPAASLRFTSGIPQSLCLRLSTLCLAASNLSMLDSRVQSRIHAGDSRTSLFSPWVNYSHHYRAQKYHDLTLWHLRTIKADELKRHSPELLVALVLLAYYNHASTDHYKFRLAVWDSVRFVLLNKESIIDSPDGPDSLQLWYRLCMSHRPAKPPALLLEGEGISSFSPNLLSATTNHIYLKCILGMSVDDLIYDILIKTLEIRMKLVVYRCVAGSCQISDLSVEIGTVAHGVLSKLLGRNSIPDEYHEARDSYVRGSHLLGLLDVQKERLKVWTARISKDQLPMICHSFSTHQDTMNALYCMLCEIAFEEAKIHDFSVDHDEYSPTRIENYAWKACQIASTVDLTLSTTSDVYTLSLTEILLQLVLLWRSDTIFHYILGVLWQQIENNGKGYEHSHYPTHLVKRIITQMEIYWEKDRAVTFAIPAVPETISKVKLLDIKHPIDLVVGGYNRDGQHFVEKIRLP